MSIDTYDEASTAETLNRAGNGADRLISSAQWESLRERAGSAAGRRRVVKVFGRAADGGAVYRWGVSAATSAPCDPVVVALSRLAVGQRLGKQARHEADLVNRAEAWIQWADAATTLTSRDAASTVLWAAAAADLTKVLPEPLWAELIRALVQLRESVVRQQPAASVDRLIVGAEVGLTMAWRLSGLTAAKQLRRSAIDAWVDWTSDCELAVESAIEHPTAARLVLASVIRNKLLIEATTKRQFTKQAHRIGDLLATWIAAMTIPGGGTAFSAATRRDVADDLGGGGLLSRAADFDRESLPNAFDAALGKTPSGGRLAWQVTLPEALHHDPCARLACMFCDWDVRRGRTYLDYSGEDVRIELYAGRSRVMAGSIQVTILTGGNQQHPIGEWSEICEHSDDDVHYLEIEQPWTGGLLLQRQFMLVRDDQCLLLADTVLPASADAALGKIEYRCRLPVDPAIHMQMLAETRECCLGDSKQRAMILPLSAEEWRVGPTNATLGPNDNNHLQWESGGQDRLYAPLWIDFQRRRFKRKRTWRQLTVGDQLRLVRRDEAVAYRVQVGSEHWVIYRSLADQVGRSFLGKHLVAEFFSSRFDPEDGDHETLIIVDDSQHES